MFYPTTQRNPPELHPTSYSPPKSLQKAAIMNIPNTDNNVRPGLESDCDRLVFSFLSDFFKNFAIDLALLAVLTTFKNLRHGCGTRGLLGVLALSDGVAVFFGAEAFAHRALPLVVITQFRFGLGICVAAFVRMAHPILRTWLINYGFFNDGETVIPIVSLLRMVPQCIDLLLGPMVSANVLLFMTWLVFGSFPASCPRRGSRSMNRNNMGGIQRLYLIPLLVQPGLAAPLARTTEPALVSTDPSCMDIRIILIASPRIDVKPS
jgi:hypothetical protein